MKNKFYLLLIGILIVLTYVFTYKYVKNESPVYIFDYSGYYEQYKENSQSLLSNPKDFIRGVISSIRNSDYNCASILLCIPFYLIFNTSRFGYILATSLLYVVPTIMLSVILIKKMLMQNQENNENKNATIIFTIIIFVLSFLYTRWWSPTLRGLPDIIAVIPIAIVAIMVNSHSFLEKQKLRIPIVVGFLLYLSFLFRRYFVYAIIGFYVSLFIVELIDFIKSKEDKKGKFINAVRNFMIAGLTTIICVVVIQMPLAKKILGENYSEAYSAYQVEPSVHITNAINEFGYVVLILAIIGGIYAVSKKEHRKNGLFATLNILICYGTFMQVQAMGVHHYLSISLWVLILFIYGIYAIYELLKNNVAKLIWISTIIILMTLNFATTYIFRNSQIPFLTQNNKYCKFYYENFDGVEKLIADLDKLINQGTYKVSALASSEILSDNLIYLLGTEKIKSSLVYTSAIDLRDGINFNSLMSDYMVVTDIPQTGSSVEGQRIVSVPNNEIINSTSIGKAYSLISGPYIIKDNVKAYIYHKDRPFTMDEVDEYMEILIGYYPQWREKYNYFDRATLASERTLGEVFGDVRRYTYDTLYFVPGVNQTIYKIDINHKINELDLRLYIDKNVKKEDETAGNVLLTIKGDNSILYEGEINTKKEDTTHLDLSGYSELTFIVDKNENLNNDYLYAEIKNITFIN